MSNEKKPVYRCPKCKSKRVIVAGKISINANETTVYEVTGLDWFHCLECKFEEERIKEDTDGMDIIEKLGDHIFSELEKEWIVYE